MTFFFIADLQFEQDSGETSSLLHSASVGMAQKLGLESFESSPAHMWVFDAGFQLGPQVRRRLGHPHMVFPWSCLASSEYGGWVACIPREQGTNYICIFFIMSLWMSEHCFCSSHSLT